MRLLALLAPFVIPLLTLGAPPDWRPGQPEWRSPGSESWRTIVSDGNELNLAFPPDSPMALAFNFKAGAGYCIAQRDFVMEGELPDNYEFSCEFWAAPGTPVNNLEFKLLDETGENVWWVVKRSFDFATQRQHIVYKKRHLQFAWGPGGAAKPLTRISKLEIVVSSATGGKGTVYVDNLTFRPLPAAGPHSTKPTIAAVSPASPGSDPAKTIDADKSTAWAPPLDEAAPDPKPLSLTLDYGTPVEVGGFALRLSAGGLTRGSFSIESSLDQSAWTPAFTNQQVTAPIVHAALAPLEARYFRFSFLPPIPAGFAVADITALPPAFAEDRNVYWQHVAADYPRGTLPKYCSGERSAWTVVGVPGGRHEALINEEGMVEVDRSCFSLEPFLFPADTPHLQGTWAQSRCEQSLDAPGCPRVTRTSEGLKLAIVPVAVGTDGASTLIVEYTLTNTADHAQRGSMVLAVRPFQVNPPWQFLNNPGGAAYIRSIRQDGNDLLIDAKRVMVDATPEMVRVAPAATEAGAGEYDPAPAAVSASARGAFGLKFDIPVGGSQTWYAVVPFEGSARPAAADLSRWCREQSDAARQAWSDRLAGVTFTVPAAAQAIIDSVRANLAYILINRDGPGFQPGSRSYERSWIRDGSMTSAAMLEFGFAAEVKEFIAWYAAHQFPSGKVPCVVDSRGPDPVPENDSHGQLIYALAEYYRYTGDKAFVEAQFPRVQNAVEYIRQQLATRMTDEFHYNTSTRQEPGKPAVPITAFYGLMPESISHEGYSSKPMHSYWDDYFTLKGLRDGAYLAGALGKAEEADKCSDMYGLLRRSVRNSIEIAQRAHTITYIPGCVELGDFDATSTAVAITPCGVESVFHRDSIYATFDKYWAFFQQRRDDPNFQWVDYTPYELRLIGVMVRLGHRGRANEMLDWFMKDQTPPAWHQWAEIVHRDKQPGKWIGDMPHTWVGSDFIRSVSSMFVYEEEIPPSSNTNLVLFAGIPAAWLENPKGVAFKGMRTPFGTLNASLKKDGAWYELSYDGLDRVPSGGFVILKPPVAWPPKEFKVTTGGASSPNHEPVGITTGLTIRFR